MLLLTVWATHVAQAANHSNQQNYVRTSTGLYLKIGDAQMRVDVVTSDVVRMRWTKEIDFLGNGTAVCLKRSETPQPFSLHEKSGKVTLQTASLLVDIDLASGAVTYREAATGNLLLAENESPRTATYVPIERVEYDESTRRTEKTADGEKSVADVLNKELVGHTWQLRNSFVWQDDEALYGLGSHMEDYMNLRGHTLYLCQHNLKAMIPVLISTKGYGLLFDAGCSMLFSDEDASFVELNAAKEVDYYFMYGGSMDRTIAAYRQLTGSVPMLPRYMFGYIQSKERYRSSQELIDVVQEYRRREIPLDVIVQDWNYWPEGWGYMKMDPRYYPDPAALADSIHAMDARLMVSIWPNPQRCPQFDDFKQRGYMLERSVYNAFMPEARRYYWQTADKEFFSRGFDAWWCDCSEPLDGDWGSMPAGYGWNNHKERWEKNTALLSEVLGPERAAIYSLYHAQGVYEGQRLTTDRKRVVNLTRSAYAGQQRYATITWNGDTYASWESFRRQIPAGLNFMAAGAPYWTVDVGAFFTRPDKREKQRWFYVGEFPEGVASEAYREFYLRMFQWATFLPLLRSHGTDIPREVWRFGEPGQPYYDAIVEMIHLRYRMLPYVYSLAGAITHEHYTMARLLAFDFGRDQHVYDIKDQYMFGPSFLVCPVTESKATSRAVYLPAGAEWIDFWSKERYAGGQTIVAAAPLNQLPLFVKPGSIIPMGPVVQYTGEAVGKPMELHIYPGADADFTWYDDAGDSYDYEQGAFATVALHWDDAKQRLTIGAREGSYEEMPAVQSFAVEVHHVGKTIRREVQYSGDLMRLKLAK